MDKRDFFIEFSDPTEHAISYFLGMLHDTRITTLQKVRDLSIPELDWQFKPGWNTIGALLSHTIALEHYFRIEYVEDRKLTAEEDEKWLPALDLGPQVSKLIRGLPMEYYHEAFTESRSLFLESFKQIDFNLFTRRRDGYDPEAGCNMAWVLYHMIEDEIQHRGQIALLRKLHKETGASH